MNQHLAVKTRRLGFIRLLFAAVILFLFISTSDWEPVVESASAEEEHTERKSFKQDEIAGPKTIIELQPFRHACSIRITKSGNEVRATLINLNPAINVWYLLQIEKSNGRPEVAYHLENPEPHTQKLALVESNTPSVMIFEGAKRYPCDLFFSGALERARGSKAIYAPLCESRIYLRNPAAGNRTSLESATEFLREHVWGGEQIVALGHILMGEQHREPGVIKTPGQTPAGAETNNELGDLPLSGLIDPKFRGGLLKSGNLGIDTGGPGQSGMIPGAWYPAHENPGVYVSILQPNLIDPAILSSYQSAVNRLDRVEAASVCYLVAFDLDRFDIGFALGSEHPAVKWSDHMLERMRDPALPGPDGIGTLSPLVATGLISPNQTGKTVATFTGGFKRAHGAFKYGELAQKNHGSHYGFIENGVVFSKLQPGLATLLIFNDGAMDIRTWTDASNKLLPRIRYARQNGVALIEIDHDTKKAVPGAMVRVWGPGNWSGSQDGKLRTIRSGAALQIRERKRFLIYAVFSDATPSAMVRIFQAYQCNCAMLLDMNALEHTYFALYRRSGPQLFIDHLLKGMSGLDKSASGQIVPRFLGFADNRDFFYVMRRNDKDLRP